MPSRSFNYNKLYQEPFASASLPYTYQYGNKNQTIWYFGVAHSHDPNDEVFSHLDRSWKRFTESAKGSKLVFVEDGPFPPEETLHEAILIGGEGGYITSLAASSGIPIECPEPSYLSQRKILRKNFDDDDVIAYFFFARSIVQWNRNARSTNFEAYVKRLLARYQTQLNISDHHFTLKALYQTHVTLFQSDFDQTDETFFNDLIFPSHDTPINEVSLLLNTFRDNQVLDRIADAWAQGLSLFIVYGASHAVMHQEHIAKLTGQQFVSSVSR